MTAEHIRRDLLALTDDDLIALANRGTVKRAHKELARMAPPVIERQGDGGLVFEWADATCHLGADVALTAATCTCISTGFCRHRVRSALAYRAAAGDLGAARRDAAVGRSGAGEEAQPAATHGAAGDDPNGAAGDAAKGDAGDAPKGDAGGAVKTPGGDAPKGDAGDAVKTPVGDAPKGDAGDAVKTPVGDAPKGDAGDAAKGASGRPQDVLHSDERDERASTTGPVGDATGAAPRGRDRQNDAEGPESEGRLATRVDAIGDAIGDAVAPSPLAPSSPVVGEPWDPGRITDEALLRAFGTRRLRAVDRAKAPLVAHLVRSAKPTARFFHRGVTVRFLVPDDPRYTICDCAEQAPCGHVPLAVHAFRDLPEAAPSGIVEFRDPAAPSVADASLSVERTARALVEFGVANAPVSFRGDLARLEQSLLQAGLSWPAAVVADLTKTLEAHARQDARFAPERVAALVGELLIRADAMKADVAALPRLFVRGSVDFVSETIRNRRYVGLGTIAEQHRGAAELVSYLVDESTGQVAAVRRTYVDPVDDPPPVYPKLARRVIGQGMSAEAVGSGQLLVQRARRAADNELLLARSRVSLTPQTYAWGTLSSAVRAEDFTEVAARLYGRPPPALAPRWVGDDVFVVPVARAEPAIFSEFEQALTATLHDPVGQAALLRFPYTDRGKTGCAQLRWALAGQSIRFISGRFALDHGVLVVAPIGLVIEHDGRPQLVQPWIGEQPPGAAPFSAPDEGFDEHGDPLASYVADACAALGELLLLGTERVDQGLAARYRALDERAAQLGSATLRRPIRAIADALEQATRSRVASAASVVRTALTACVVFELARSRVRL